MWAARLLNEPYVSHIPVLIFVYFKRMEMHTSRSTTRIAVMVNGWVRKSKVAMWDHSQWTASVSVLPTWMARCKKINVNQSTHSFRVWSVGLPHEILWYTTYEAIRARSTKAVTRNIFLRDCSPLLIRNTTDILRYRDLSLSLEKCP